MNLNVLEKHQLALQKEANEIIDEIQIIPFLSQFGKPEVIGSVALGLMTWPDIDIELVKDINEEEYWQTVKYIVSLPKIKSTTVIDYRKSTNPITPKGLYINVRYYSKQPEPWKIDIWFIPSRHKDDQNMNTWLKEHLQNEHRLPILEIKAAISANPKYRKEIFSTDIYKAVIENGVKNLDGFLEYLKGIGKSLLL